MINDMISVPRELLERIRNAIDPSCAGKALRLEFDALLTQRNTCTKDGGQDDEVEPVAWEVTGCGYTLTNRYPDWAYGPGSEDYTVSPLYRHPPAQAPAVLPPEDDQRAAFEAFFTERSKTLPLPLGGVTRYAGGQYVSDYALFGWIVWLACLDEFKRLNPTL